MAALHLGIGEEPLLEAQELLLSAGGIELVYAGPGQACLAEDEDVVGFGQAAWRAGRNTPASPCSG